MLIGLVAALTVVTWGTWGDLDSDTGFDVQAGTRLADGQIPYRDFIYYYGPLAPFLTAFAALAGGAGFGPAILLGFLITLAIIAATYAVTRTLAGPLAALIASTITAAVAFIPDDYNYVLPHTGDATLGTLILLGVLLAVRRYAVSASPRWSLAIGSLLGLLALTKPEPAIAGFIGVATWLALRRRAGIASRGEIIRVAGPAVLIPGLVYGSFMAIVTPDRLLFENLYPREFLAENPLVTVRLPLDAHSFIQLGGKLALYALGVAAIAGAATLLTRQGRVRPALVGVLAAGLVVAVTASLIRPEAMRHGLEFAYGWIPAGAAIAAVMLTWRLSKRTDGLTAQRQVELAGIVALTVYAATSYPAFFPHAPYEQIAVYAMPLAAIFMVRLHLGTFARNGPAYALGVVWLAFLASAGLGLTIKDARLDAVTVHGAGGSLAETRNEAALYQGALAWIERTTSPDEPIFVAPLMPALYTLSERTNPTEQLSVLPGSLTASGEAQTIAALEEAGTRLVITDDREWHVYGHGAFGDTFDRTLAAWISRHFERVAVLRSPPWHSFEGDIPPRQLFIWLKRR